MNRSILIVICDFLLLSLLTFTTDINRLPGEKSRPPLRAEIATNEVAGGANGDLAAAMKLALEEEQQNRARLEQRLAQSGNQTSEQEKQLKEREQENAQLQQEFAVAQTNLAALNQRMQSNAERERQSQAEFLALQLQAQQQSNVAAQLQEQLNQLAQSNQLAQAEKQKLSGQLLVAMAEQRAANDKAAMMQQEVQAQRVENAKLTEGFKTLATNSSQLVQEIRDNRPLAPNAIYSEFMTNHVAISIFVDRSGFLGIDSNKDRRTQTVLVTDGTNIFALCHVQDTPLKFGDPGTDWDTVLGSVTGAKQVPIHSLAFNQQDPRVVMVPVRAEDARELGCKPFRISSDPYKFQDAVLIGADEGYYGECNFQIDADLPQYVRLDRNLLKGLFGKFNPSRGDLVFSRTGEMLGIMVNSTYCLTIHNFAAAATLKFGDSVHTEHTGDLLAQFYDQIFQLPLKLQ